MTATAPETVDLSGKKQVRLRLRPNLLLVPQEEAGQREYVLKDPVSLRYFRLDERQHFLISLLDGTRTLEEVRRAYENAFRPDRLPAEELEAFAAQLLNNGLAVNESPLAGRLLFQAAEKDRRKLRQAALLQFLCIRIPLFDPDRLLARLLRPLALVGSRWTLLLGLGLVASALLLTATHWQEVLTRLPAQREFFCPRTLLYLWLTLGLLKILHELGHGLCCKAFGGEVHEAGILLLMFFPALYCDVSDSWKLPGRWRRIAIAAAGIGVDLLAAALATFAWWGSEPRTLLHNLSLGAMIVCGVNSLLINGNPLARFDGYFVLADWARVPNLAETAAEVLRATALRWFGIGVPVEGPVGRRRLFVGLYGVVSYIYRAAILIFGLWALHLFLEPRKLGSLCLLLGVGVALSMLGWPAWCLLRAVHRCGGFREMKLSRVLLCLGVLVTVAVFVWTVPLPHGVEGVALVEADPESAARIVVPDTGGFLRQVFVRDGQRVQEGDVLALLACPKLEIALRVNEADQALRQQQQSALVGYLAESRVPVNSASADLQEAEFETQALQRQQALLKEQSGRLTLRAPCAGVVMGLQPPEQLGKWLDKGTDLCRVGNDRSLRAVLVVGPAERDVLRLGIPARLRVHGCGTRSWPATLASIAQADARTIPPHLSNHAGGEVPTQQDPLTRQEQPRSQQYIVAVQLEGADRMIHPGVLGRVRLDAGSETILWRLQRYLGTTFHWGL